jgi:Lrp/AsnC family transcriptional regulator, leucine-responsive regulatory protein
MVEITMQLDSFDLAILNLLQVDNQMSQRDISDQVHLSSSAVNRRITAMEQAGVIRANVALVDAAKVGRPVTVVVELSLQSERADLLDAMKARFHACPDIQQAYYVTGEVDFVLVLHVSDMASYERLTQSLFLSDSNVQRFRTLVVMDQVKSSLRVSTS